MFSQRLVAALATLCMCELFIHIKLACRFDKFNRMNKCGACKITRMRDEGIV